MSTFSPSISSAERNFLFSLPECSWGLLSTPGDPQIIISKPFRSLQEANELNKKLSLRLTQALDRYSGEGNKVFKLKKYDESGYVVMALRHIVMGALPKTTETDLEGNLQVLPAFLPAETDITESDQYDLKKHPLDLLNEWKATDPEYIKRSFHKQLERAVDFHESTPNNNAWVMKDPRKYPITSLSSQIGTLSTSYAGTKGKRPFNEDLPFSKEATLKLGKESITVPLIGILDGHSSEGGAARSHTRYFDKHLIGRFEGYFEREYEKLTTEQKNQDEWIDLVLFNALKLSFVNISSEIGVMKTPYMSSGTTATLSLIFNGHIYTACAGDSRAMYVTENAMVPLSWDAKVFNPESSPENSEKLNRSLINRGSDFVKIFGMYRTESGLAVTHALGHERNDGINPRCKITKIRIDENQQENAFIIIASDGLWDVASCSLVGKTVLEKYKEGNSSEVIAQYLVQMALYSGSKDNITVCITPLSNRKLTHDISPTEDSIVI